ncbi:MAG: hypothetical protein U0586_16065, partial [Candidatus Brocadiaceae bacterium]
DNKKLAILQCYLRNDIVVLTGRALLEKPFIYSPTVLTFRAEAGHEYKFDGRQVPDEKYDRWIVWVEDVKTGSVVGGEKTDITESKKEDNSDQKSDNEGAFK